MQTQFPSLSELQQWMRWVLTHPHGVGCALKNHRHPLQHCIRVIGQTPQVDRVTRLSIYGNGYFGRIIEAMESNFSSVKNIIGQKAFGELARNYLVKHPSTFKSIDDIGHKMPEFIASHSLVKQFPFLPDLANLEWRAHQSFFADDLPLLDLKVFKNKTELEWRDVKIGLDPSVILLKVRWPVDEIWRVDGNLKLSRTKKLKKTNLFILVYRRADKIVRVPRLSRIQYELLNQLSLGKTLRQSLMLLSRKGNLSKNGTFPIKTWFGNWTREGVIRKIEF